MTDARRKFGTLGERAVEAWYREKGYDVLAANWRCSEGELDLVLDVPGGATTVFCEVKSRTSERFGTGFDAVTPVKQRRLRKLAARWLSEHRAGAGARRTREVRFDVAVVTPGSGGSFDVEVLCDAF